MSFDIEFQTLDAGSVFHVKAINAIVFLQEDHCRAAYESEMARADMPGEYRGTD